MGDLPGGQVVKTLLFYCMRGGFDPWWGNWDPTCHCYCSCCCWVASVVSDSATPETAAHQAPLSLGFSRKDHWSGLPFPSPMHDSEKWKGSHSVVSDSSQPHGLQPTRLLCPWDFPGKSTGVGCHCLLRPHATRHSKKKRKEMGYLFSEKDNKASFLSSLPPTLSPVTGYSYGPGILLCQQKCGRWTMM